MILSFPRILCIYMYIYIYIYVSEIYHRPLLSVCMQMAESSLAIQAPGPTQVEATSLQSNSVFWKTKRKQMNIRSPWGMNTAIQSTINSSPQLDKMAAVSQPVFPYVPSIGLDNCMAPDRRHAINRTNTDPIDWHIYTALGGYQLTEISKGCSDAIFPLRYIGCSLQITNSNFKSVIF